MKALVLVALLFVATQAHHNGYHALEIDHSKVVPVNRHMNVLEDAPRPQEGSIVTGPSRGQYPFVVAIYLNGRSFCGGSLISNQWVLTAGRCASGITTFTVYLGAYNLGSSEEGRIIIETTSKIVHPAYNTITLTNDIALINLGTTVTTTNYIKPIKFATSTPVLTTVRTCGWTATSSTGSSGVSFNCKDYSVINSTICQQHFGIILSPSLICVSPGSTSCLGDSGGAVFIPASESEEALQVGMMGVFTSAGCTEPLGFTRVASFASWITSNTGIAGA